MEESKNVTRDYENEIMVLKNKLAIVNDNYIKLEAEHKELKEAHEKLLEYHGGQMSIENDRLTKATAERDILKWVVEQMCNDWRG